MTFAERKVQQDRDQVAQDEDRLDSSRSQLDLDNQSLTRAQRDSKRAQSATTPAPATPRLDSAIEQRIPSRLLPKAPTLNTLGETIGKLINVVA
ncbi:hypothetical protein [Pseudoduganella violaceinigra]|uniref:hypothetical protein n=1 Tax=Pseudoduganella violaceinigra TaxID=246602 RepID=UPI0004030B13|nr:hypothetical protein [Pseudoduganella violaceinigra]